MGILNILTDKHPKTAKLILSCNPAKDTPTTVRAQLKDKTKIPAFDVWSVDPSCKWEKAKDPTKILLGAKLDNKTPFAKGGCGEVIYVKKKGAPPNAVDGSPAKTPAPPTPKEAPPAPPTPKAEPPPPPTPPATKDPPPQPAAVKSPPPPPQPAVVKSPPPPPQPAAVKSPPPPPPVTATPPPPPQAVVPPPPPPPAVVPPPPPPPVTATPPPPPQAVVAPPPPPPAMVTPPPPPQPVAVKSPPPPPAAEPPKPQPPKVEEPEPAAPKSPPSAKDLPPEGRKKAHPAPPAPKAPPAPAKAQETPSSPPPVAAPRAAPLPKASVVPAGSAVEAFVEELSQIGGGGQQEPTGQLGALMAELSMRPEVDRAELREMGKGRARSPMARWAQEHRDEAVSGGILEVAGLIAAVEQGAARRFATPPASRPAARRGGGSKYDEAFRPVREFLFRIRMEKFEEVFAEAEFDLETLLEVNEKDLLELGITALGARKRFLLEIGKEKHGRTLSDDPPVPYAHTPPSHSDPYSVEREAVARAMRRDHDLERRWEEVALMGAAGHGYAGAAAPDEWDRRWDTARRYDQAELSRWRSEPPHYRCASPPAPSRHAILVQRLNDLQASSHAYPALPGRPASPGKVRSPSPTRGAGSMWETFYTPEGVPYYHNRATNTTQWHMPAAPRGRSPRGRRSPCAQRTSPTHARRYGY